MPFAFMPAPFCSHFLLRETDCRNVYVFILYRLYLICLKHLHLQDESSSFPLDLSEVERPWWKMASCCADDHPFPSQISALIVLVGCSTLGHILGGSAMHALSTELWIRPGGNGRKNLTSSFICNGISDFTTPIYLCLSKCKNLKQTSVLFPQKF